MSIPIRLGVVGPGLIWHGTHKPQIQRLGAFFEVVAFAAGRLETAEAAAAEFPGARIYADYAELASAPDVDALLVTTPIPLNGAVAMAGLEAGKDVFVEKPLAASVEEAWALVETELRSEGRLYILEQVVYTDAWKKVHGWMQSGEIGKAALIERSVHGLLDPVKDPYGYGKTAWRRSPKYPLGPLFDGGIHEVAVLAELAGTPRAVTACAQVHRPEYGEWDVITMLIEYDSGILCQFSHSALLGGRRNSFTIRGTRGLLNVGEYGISIEPVDEEPRDISFDRATVYGAMHETMWNALVACRKSGRPPKYTAQMAYRDIALVFAVDESIRSNQKVEIKY